MERFKKVLAALVFLQCTQLCVAFFMCAGWGWTWEMFFNAYIIPLALVACLLIRLALEWSIKTITNN